MDAICESRWTDVTRCYQLADGRRLILPMARAPRPVPFESSQRTHWGFGGLLADGGVQPGDIALVATDLGQRRALRTAVRPNPLRGAEWMAATTGATQIARRAHAMDLSGGIDDVLGRMPRQGRKSLRAAERRGVVVESDANGALLPAFFELLMQSRERWAEAQREPKLLARFRYRMYDTLEKWQRIQQHIGAACRVYVARQDGEALAAGIVLFGKNVHHTRSASSRALAAKTYASEAIVGAAVQDACRSGARTYHMGESGESASLAQFKEKLGCRPYDYPEVRYERLPLTALDQRARSTVKRLIGFTDIR
jgi:lipid II:glycine glycyltransferase (peptidoglycan interpeptide bridge formation enzyme)